MREGRTYIITAQHMGMYTVRAMDGVNASEVHGVATEPSGNVIMRADRALDEFIQRREQSEKDAAEVLLNKLNASREEVAKQVEELGAIKDDLYKIGINMKWEKGGRYSGLYIDGRAMTGGQNPVWLHIKVSGEKE